MTNSQAELDELKGRSQDLDRFRSSLQKLTDEFSSLRQAAESVLGRLRDHDQFVDSRKDEVKQLLIAATDTIKTFEGRKEDLIHEIHSVLNQVQSSFNRLSGEIGSKAVETINTTSLQIFQLRKSLLDFTEKKSEELSAALSAFEADLHKLKTEQQQAFRNLPAVNEQILLAEDRLKGMILSGLAQSDSLREEAEARSRETRQDLDRLDQRVRETHSRLERTRQEIEAALGNNRDELLRALGESERKWDQLTAGHSDIRRALDTIESSQRQYEYRIEELKQDVDTRLRDNTVSVSAFSASFTERIEEIQDEYRRQMTSMLERVESATGDTERHIGIIRQEIENTLRESSERISGFLISSEEKINDLKLNHYQTRAAVDRIERSQQESEKAAAAMRVELSETVRESRDLLSDFASMTNQKIEEVKSAQRRELDNILSRLETVRRESESAVVRAKQESEKALKDRLDHVTGFLQSSEEKLDAVRSEQLSLKVSLDRLDHSREEADRTVAALSGSLGEMLRRSKEEVAGLLQGVEDRLRSLRDEHEGLKTTLVAPSKEPDEAKLSREALLQEFTEIANRQSASVDARCDALASEHREGLAALRKEIEALKGEAEAQLAAAVRTTHARLDHLRTEHDHLIGTALDASKAAHAQAIEEVRRDLSGSLDELAVDLLETRNALTALKEMTDRIGSAVALQIPATPSVTEETVTGLRTEIRQVVDGLLERLDYAVRENESAIEALKQDVESSLSSHAQRLSQFEDSSREHLAKASFERLQEVHALRQLVERSREETAQLLASFKQDVESSLGRHAEELSHLGSATDERLTAVRSNHGDLKDAIERVRLALTGTDRDLATLRERTEHIAAETIKPLGELASQFTAKLNDAQKENAGDIDALRLQLTSLHAEHAEMTRTLAGQASGLVKLRDEMRESLEERPALSEEALSQLRSEQLKEITMILERIESVRGEHRKAVDELREELAQRIAGEDQEIRTLLQDTTAQVAELRAGTGVITTVLEHVESLKEDNEKTFSSMRQEFRQAVSARAEELAEAIGATQETVELLKSRYLELQAFTEAMDSHRIESEKAITGLHQEIERQLKGYLADSGGQTAPPAADLDKIQAGFRSVQDKVTEAVSESKRIQGELQEEIQYRTRETREQLTSLIERKTHQFKESFTTLVEHKDTMLKSAVFGSVKKQKSFTLLMFLVSILISFALFYFGKR